MISPTCLDNTSPQVTPHHRVTLFLIASHHFTLSATVAHSLAPVHSHDRVTGDHWRLKGHQPLFIFCPSAVDHRLTSRRDDNESKSRAAIVRN